MEMPLSSQIFFEYLLLGRFYWFLGSWATFLRLILCWIEKSEIFIIGEQRECPFHSNTQAIDRKWLIPSIWCTSYVRLFGCFHFQCNKIKLVYKVSFFFFNNSLNSKHYFSDSNTNQVSCSQLSIWIISKNRF